MALFQKFQQRDNLFTVARQEPTTSQDEGFITLVVGLGNVGKEYEGTRHNFGFKAVDCYAEKHGFPAWQEKSKFKAYITEDFVAGKKVVLAKPTTLYNLSGESVRLLKDFYKLDNKDIIIVHDELDLPFGTVREKVGGGSAGSNGLKSIISHIQSDFKRIRLGIKNDLLTDSTNSRSQKKIDPADFVLSKFSSEEKKQLDTVLAQAIELL